MNAKQLFNKTMPFCMAKLALGAINVILCLVLFGILMGIGWLFDGIGIIICLSIWLFAVKGINLLVMHYGGYLVKAGHVAVIAEVMKTGQVPKNQVEYGKTLVQERFVTANVYFAIDQLVNGAIKQIQREIEKVGNFLNFVPGMEALEGAAKFFIQLSLGYVDECCLGWTFYKKEQNAFKSAADGVVIYAKNWKSVLKTAAMTMLKVVFGMLALVVLIFVILGILFKLLRLPSFVAFCIACLLAWLVKFAFIDSYMMCQSMGNYMEVAPTTEIPFDLYGQFCAVSDKFKELFEKGREGEGSSQQTQAMAGMMEVKSQPQPQIQAQPQAKTIFCGECGTKNEANAGFCGNCGAKLVK